MLVVMVWSASLTCSFASLPEFIMVGWLIWPRTLSISAAIFPRSSKSLSQVWLSGVSKEPVSEVKVLTCFTSQCARLAQAAMASVGSAGILADLVDQHHYKQSEANLVLRLTKNFITASEMLP